MMCSEYWISFCRKFNFISDFYFNHVFLLTYKVTDICFVYFFYSEQYESCCKILAFDRASKTLIDITSIYEYIDAYVKLFLIFWLFEFGTNTNVPPLSHNALFRRILGSSLFPSLQTIPKLRITLPTRSSVKLAAPVWHVISQRLLSFTVVGTRTAGICWFNF